MSDGREAGSVVIEAMIAALIISGMAAVLLETITTNAAATRGIAERRQAMLVAQSLMNTAGGSGSVASGIREGVDGSFIWRVAITPEAVSAGAASAGVLEHVAVTVRDDRPGSVPLAKLDSLRFGR